MDTTAPARALASLGMPLRDSAVAMDSISVEQGRGAAEWGVNAFSEPLPRVPIAYPTGSALGKLRR
jgi:hypothetical protein